MNQRKAKQLRRGAERLTVGKPAISYKNHTRWETRTMSPCTRRVYQVLKHRYRILHQAGNAITINDKRR